MHLDFIRPGEAVENTYIESFNGKLRDECLNTHQFRTLDDAKAIIEAWRHGYSGHRPHDALGHLTPRAFVMIRQESRGTEAA